ncbi:MAG: (2Fe-2S)-binding protein [Chlorobiaceae bacterium]|nr:(2Fe-2S)-binding protein [Chlorobiaceae bacterium]NTV15989.1 (2Fe-2S)-binding protein [Chlorobiaceae bacterium]
MNISINNNLYEANKGDRLLDIARSNHAHIGYFCGGNGICQTCYVKVIEGSELLSPLSEEEKALLSDNLIVEGTRMACMATVEKPGTIKVISAVEEVKHMFETNPLQLAGYAAKMGREALVKFPDTMRLQSRRDFDLLQLFTDIIGGIGDAIQLMIQAFTLPFSGEADHEHTESTKLFENESSSCESSSSRNNNGKVTQITTRHIAA